MKKFLSPLLFIFTVSFSDEITAYKTGWIDGFSTGYSLKRAKKANIATGYWLYIPTENLPFPLIAFYVFSGQRLGFKVLLSEDSIVFGVYKRKVDAEFYKKLLESKGIKALVSYREGEKGWEGFVYNAIYVPEKYGVEGVIYHLRKAIQKAKEIDPTVLNRNLLIKDLEKILKEVKKWERGKKGYSRVLPDTEKNEYIEKIRKFVEERE